MSPMPIASVTRAPQAASSRARSSGSPPPGSPATSSRRNADPARSIPRAAAPLGEVQRVGRRQRHRIRAQSRVTAASSRSLCPAPTGMRQSPSASKASSATPATNGPAS